MSIPDTKNYSLMALLLLTALLVGKSVNGYPGGGETGGDEWAAESIVKGCTCHTDEQLNEGMYSLNGIPNTYVPEVTYNITLTVNDTNVDSVDGSVRYGGFLAEVADHTFHTMTTVTWLEVGLSNGPLLQRVQAMHYSLSISISWMEPLLLETNGLT